MNFTVLQENLLPVIQDSLRFISNKPQLPILSGVYLNAKAGEIQIRSTDLKVGFHTKIRGKVEEEGETVIPAKTISDFLSQLSAGPVSFSITQGTCEISQGKTTATIQVFPATDFPPFPEITAEEVTLAFPQFSSTIENVSYAAGIDETRPILASILFVMENNSLTCVGTDGYRLAISSTNAIGEDISTTILVNAKSCTEVVRTIGKSKPEKIGFGLSKELQQVRLSVGDTYFLLRLTEGEFPPYQSIIPSSFLITAEMNKDELFHALKTSLIFARENSSIVTLSLSNAACAIQAAKSSIGENKTVIDCSYKGEEEKNISFNAKFLLDVLSHIDTEQVEFCMNDELKPVLLVGKGSDSQKNIIMPFKR